MHLSHNQAYLCTIGSFYIPLLCTLEQFNCKIRGLTIHLPTLPIVKLFNRKIYCSFGLFWCIEQYVGEKVQSGPHRFRIHNWIVPDTDDTRFLSWTLILRLCQLPISIPILGLRLGEIILFDTDTETWNQIFTWWRHLIIHKTQISSNSFQNNKYNHVKACINFDRTRIAILK